MDGPVYRPVSAIPLGGRPPGGPDDPAAAQTARHRDAVLLRRRVAALVAICGALLVILGTALPWATIELSGARRVVRTGWTDPFDSLRWGPILAVLGFVVVLVLTPVAAIEAEPDGGSAPRVVRWLAIAAAVVATIAVLVAALALVGAADGPVGTTVSLEVGPFLMLSGALLASVGAVLAAVARPPAMVTPPRAVGAVG